MTGVVLEERRERGSLDERAVRGPGDRRQLGHRRQAGGRGLGGRALVRGGRREQGGGRDLLEVALGDRRVGVVRGDDLACCVNLSKCWRSAGRKPHGLAVTGK